MHPTCRRLGLLERHLTPQSLHSSLQHGTSNPTAAAAAVALPSPAPFNLDIPQSELDSLRARLLDTRWPDEPDGAGWDYGTPVGFMQQVVEHWLETYDWRVAEAELNALPRERQIGGSGGSLER